MTSLRDESTLLLLIVEDRVGKVELGMGTFSCCYVDFGVAILREEYVPAMNSRE